MKNKTKIGIPVLRLQHDVAEPFMAQVACTKCDNEREVKVFPALGPNFFECKKCQAIIKVVTEPTTSFDGMAQISPEVEMTNTSNQ